MMSNVSVSHTIILVAVSVLVTVLLRAFPFLVFNGKKEMPKGVKIVADSLPPAIMGVLVIYCLKDYILSPGSTSVAAAVAVVAVVILHLWRRNVLMSIAAGTFIYMILIRAL